MVYDGIPVVYKAMSRNRFEEIKRYIHLANNDLLSASEQQQDKLFKVRPLFDLMNKSLNQFGRWHLDYSVDEQMVPYTERHSAKQTNREKNVRFGYPYYIIPYGGAKGVHGTSGKDLTVRVVI